VRAAQWINLAGFGAAACVLAVALVRTLGVPAIPPLRAATPTELAPLLGRMRTVEEGIHRQGVEKFAGDRWSQGDFANNHEWRKVRDESKRRGVSIGSLLGAIDADVRAHPTLPRGIERGRAAPCMPRPFYD
jgi:hypothetical protein